MERSKSDSMSNNHLPSGSSLNVGAAEFRPPARTRPWPTTTEDMVDSLQRISVADDIDSSASRKGNVSSTFDSQPWHQSSNEHHGMDDDSGWMSNWNGNDEQAALLAILRDQFPTYSDNSLLDLLNRCDGDIYATLDWLFNLEKELSVQISAGSSENLSKQKSARPHLTSEEDFPALGGSTNDEIIGNYSMTQAFGRSLPSIASSSSYAQKARAMASAPASMVTNAANYNGRAALGPTSNRQSTHESNVAPIWQSGGDIQRFTTGTAMAVDYAEARAAARDLARLRNACFEQATAAFMSGNKALAKKLGAQGREYNRQMHEAHAQAAQELFDRRNRPSALWNDGQGGRSGHSHSGTIPIIDLHGLHAAEVRDILEERLEHLHAQGREHVRIVVGVGKHGKVPARLPETVRSILSESRHVASWKETYAGLLDVSLR